jgi:serine/threonine protein phosphatase PrpC
MSDVKQLVSQLFTNNQIPIPAHRKALFEKFLQDEQTITAASIISQQQQTLMARWKQEDRVAEIIEQPVRIANATVGKPYEARIDVEQLNWKDIASLQVDGLGQVGLTYDEAGKQISGVPTQSGDINLVLRFKLDTETDVIAYHEKPLTLIINPDPKSLWKNLPSDKNDPYWKEDNVTVFATLADRHILVSSKRGRSHANVGSFREDDFAFADLENGWSIVIVADGAGSAKISRKGSVIACQGVVDHFKDPASVESMAQFDELLQQHVAQTGEETQKKLNRFVYNNLGKAVFGVHKKLEAFAANEGVTLKDLSSTLVFTLFKKYEAGYALLSFGVGDCPAAVLNPDVSAVTLLNWIDVGEFGGGTRFITMPEIFQSDKFATRFSFKLIEDFSYLILMSDGIYDPKFVVEASLPNIKKWQEFLADLNGNNADGVRVELRADNAEIKEQLTQWMDFWSPGNHDDRTLAIVF